MSSALRIEPVLAGEQTAASMTDHICGLALRRHAGTWWWIMLAPALALVAVLIVSILWLFYAGVGIWGIDWPVAWGFAIINYVWWIGIASGGTFISAMFFLLRVEWRTSLNRIAETMTLFAAACAGIYPILHLGRPWFFYWLFPYPNTMGLWPQFRSPLFWDFAAILAYVLSSVLFWFLGMMPDAASVRDRAQSRPAQLFFGVLAMGFRGSGRQWRHYRAVYGVMAAVMAPLVVSVHSIVGLDFAGGAATGWHSTEFPPFFVFGAVLSGLATVIVLVLPLRRLMHLEPFITTRHIDVLARLLLTSAICVGYAYVMDAFGSFYGGEPAERVYFIDRITGLYAYVYWSTLVLNVAVPQLLWFARLRLSQVVLMLVGTGAIVGMWLERFGIVVVSLHRGDLPSAWGDYHATVWDWSLFLGTIGLFVTGMLVFVRVLPVISMFEMRGLIARKHAR